MTQIVVDSETWTGRGHYWPDPITHLRWAVRRWLYPLFDCADCIGMIQHGCECAYYGAVAPGVGPERWRHLLRKLFKTQTPAEFSHAQSVTTKVTP